MSKRKTKTLINFEVKENNSNSHTLAEILSPDNQISEPIPNVMNIDQEQPSQNFAGSFKYERDPGKRLQLSN